MICFNLLAVTYAMICCVSDLFYGKIPNFFWIGGSACGLFLNAVLCGWQKTGSSLMGFLLPVIAGFLLFYFRMVGAGDLKELSAIGSMIGVRSVIKAGMLSIIFGAAIALAILLTEGSVRERFAYFLEWMQRQLSVNERIPYRKGEKEERKEQWKQRILPRECFHFTVPVFMAVLIVAGG